MTYLLKSFVGDRHDGVVMRIENQKNDNIRYEVSNLQIELRG